MKARRLRTHEKGTNLFLMIGSIELHKYGGKMTVKELMERLSHEDQDALVYTTSHDDDIALIVIDVKANVLEGTDETVVLVY